MEVDAAPWVAAVIAAVAAVTTVAVVAAASADSMGPWAATTWTAAATAYFVYWFQVYVPRDLVHFLSNWSVGGEHLGLPIFFINVGLSIFFSKAKASA